MYLNAFTLISHLQIYFFKNMKYFSNWEKNKTLLKSPPSFVNLNILPYLLQIFLKKKKKHCKYSSFLCASHHPSLFLPSVEITSILNVMFMIHVNVFTLAIYVFFQTIHNIFECFKLHRNNMRFFFLPIIMLLSFNYIGKHGGTLSCFYNFPLY